MNKNRIIKVVKNIHIKELNLYEFVCEIFIFFSFNLSIGELKLLCEPKISQ